MVKNIWKQSAIFDTRGVISPLILIAVIAVLGLFLVLGNFPLKDKLFGGLFPKPFSQAAGIVDLSLVPDTLNAAVGQTFLVDVAIDAKTDQPGAVVLSVNYDPAVLQAVSAQPGFFFAIDLDPTTPKITSGNILMTLGQDPTQFKSGNGIAATLEFKALQATSPTTAIAFDLTNTQVAVIGKVGDQLGLASDSVVTVTNTPVVQKSAEFSLNTPPAASAGTQFNVTLNAKAPVDANLFAARLSFDPSILEVVSIDTSNSFITQWVNDNSFDNANGQISLIGGVPNPGFASSAFSNMATIVFRGKIAGSGLIRFDANSAIYSNFENADILITPQSATVNITGVAPSPSPSVSPSVAPSPSPSPSPSPAVSPSPSAVPSIQPSASPASTPVASPSPTPPPPASPSPSVSPSPSPSPSPCTISGANWITSANPATEGTVVGLNIIGLGNCDGQAVSISVFEDDGILGTDTVRNAPPLTKFNSGNIAITSWLAEFQDDGFAGINNPPEYFFTAQLAGGSPVRSSDPQIQVNKLGTGQVLSGDVNKDGKVDLVDLSIMLTNWNKTSNFIDELDLNGDGVINAIDWSTMIQILRVTGVVK